MQPRLPLLVSVALLAAGTFACGGGAPSRPPNIVFILADDLGYMDVVAYAAKTRNVPRAETYYETPNIDRLADAGVAFTQAYANPVCSPSRAALLTGKYHARLGVTTAWKSSNVYPRALGTPVPEGHHPLDAVHEDTVHAQQAWRNGLVMMGLPAGSPLDGGLDERTLPEILLGYHSAFVGKWHLGGAGLPAYQPQQHGFNRVLAHFDSGGSPYFNWQRAYAHNSWASLPTHRALQGLTRQRGSFASPSKAEHVTDAFTDAAVEYIQEQATHPERPFFLFFSHFSVHAPFQGKPEDVAHFEQKSTRGWNGQSSAIAAAMIKTLDDSVGRVVNALLLTDQLDNTVIVFMSDNGGTGRTNHAPLQGGKGFMYEGGVRVPLIVLAPGYEQGVWSEAVVNIIDLLPTLGELAGAPVEHPIDGVSFAEQLEDASAARDSAPIYWHYPQNLGATDPATGLPFTPRSAIRKGDYKLMWDWHGRLELYDIANDIGETNDLAAAEPGRAKALFSELEAWLDANVEQRYFPTQNPNYDASLDERRYPFRDLRAELLGKTGLIGLPDAAGRNAQAALR